MLAEFERRDEYEWRTATRNYTLTRSDGDEYLLSWSSWFNYKFIFQGYVNGDGFTFKSGSSMPLKITVTIPGIKERAKQRALVAPIARQLAKRLHGVPFEDVAKFLY